MKKSSAIIIILLMLAGMTALLVSNKKKMQEQASAAAVLDKIASVATVKTDREFFRRDFTANGTTQAVRELNFVSDVSGRVTEVYVDKGSRVEKGSPLLKTDSELYEADYLAAKAAYEALKKDERRFTRSNEAGAVSSQQLDNIRTQLVAAESRMTVSRRKYESSVVKAPMGGVINFRFAEVGSLIAPNAPLFEIVDDSKIKLICNISESRLGLVREGQKVTATDNSMPGAVFSGTVKHIGIKTDRGLNYPVEVSLDKDSRLRIGMYMKVLFEDNAGHDAIIIPRKAVIGSAKSALAYVVKDGKACRRELKLGDMAGDKVEVLEGLDADEEIIVEGLMNVSDGAEVRVVNR